MKAYISIHISSFVALAVATQFASADDRGGFASAKDIIGTWKMVALTDAAKVNKVNPWPMAYQWFRFYEDGTVASMMSTEDKAYSAKQLEEIFTVIKADSPKYTLKDGMMTIRHPDAQANELWGVNLFKKDLDLARTKIKQGDILMSLDDGQGVVVYYRLLRKVKP